MTASKNNIAFDIETSGLKQNDMVTVIGFAPENSASHLFLNTDGGEYLSEQMVVSFQNSMENANIHQYDSEKSLFQGMNDYLMKMNKDVERLVAYNGESWNGGFDIPFLRTRCIKNEVDWVFNGISFADLYPPIKKRFNTTTMQLTLDNGLTKADMKDFAEYIECEYDNSLNKDPLRRTIENCEQFTADSLRAWAESQPNIDITDFHTRENDLVSVYSTVFDFPEISFDPYEDSENAAQSFEEEQFEEILHHNLADILRTREIAKLVSEYYWTEEQSYKNNVNETIL